MANKAWSVLFGLVMLGCFLGFAVSPFVGWWRPDGISTHSDDVDFLFDVITWITGFFFVLTEALLVLFLWLYASKGDIKHPVSETSEFPGLLKPLANVLHDQHRVELAWTFIPAVILLYIAFAQVNTWANIKYESRKSAQQGKGEAGALQVAVSARQFEWRMRYPSAERFQKWMSKNIKSGDYATFAKIPQADDIYVVNELHLWQNHQVVVHLSTRDVIHSFNLPNFRVKQDALPGKMIPVWFKTRNPDDEKNPMKTFNCKWDEDRGRYIDGINPETGQEDAKFIYDIACAELCGWGHYRMIGRVFVHENQTDFLIWLKSAEKYNRQRTSDR